LDTATPIRERVELREFLEAAEALGEWNDDRELFSSVDFVVRIMAADMTWGFIDYRGDVLRSIREWDKEK